MTKKIYEAIDTTDPVLRADLFRQSHEQMMQFGADHGWWTTWDATGPFNDIRLNASDCPTWEHAAVVVGLFTSKGQARKNGWSGPARGARMAKSKRIRIEIVP